MAESADNVARSPSAVARIARFVEVLAAALLVGGLVATAAVAQVAFNSPETLSREQAGRLLARIFEGATVAELALVVVIGGTWIAQRRRSLLAAIALPLAMIMCVGQYKMTERMHAIRAAHGGTVSALAADDPDRIQFGELHALYSLGALGILGFGVCVLGAHALRKGS